MKLKGAIFDLDGTLLDSMGVWEQIDRDFLSARGFEVTEDYGKTVAPMSFRQAAEYTISRFSLAERADDVMAQWFQMAEHAYAHEVKLKPGAMEYLLSLRERGIPLAVATASDEKLYPLALKSNGIEQFFSSFTGLHEVDRGKGFPDIYWKAAEKLGLPPEQCAVFEDLPQGILGAKAGGFFTVGVFDSYGAASWPQVQSDAHCCLKDFRQAVTLLAPLGL